MMEPGAPPALLSEPPWTARREAILKCTKCGGGSFAIEIARIPSASEAGVFYNVDVMRCGVASCLAVVGPIRQDDARIDRLAARLTEIETKIDRIANVVIR